MAAEEDFVLSLTGEETDNLLKHTESMKNQTTEEDGETVQVYDTNGVPHKVSKTELLKKSTLALPELEDISAFVAVNAAGNAIGLMTKEQVASVLAGLMLKKEVLDGESDLNNLPSGFYSYFVEGGIPKNMPSGQIQRGYIVSFPEVLGATSQIVFEWGWSTVYCRILNAGANWTDWIKLSN
ncbi:pyocin knob domain-containing protein [Phocaeicola plebeius]|uniref:pyocin knob domain-containing protein n=1 Tax=Phocaeicola plebeius TaxID=310297 RepID=UPI003AB2466D